MKMLLFIGLMMSAVLSQAAEPATERPTQTVLASEIQAPAGSVRRFHFTSDILEHEPVDKLIGLSNKDTEVYFFTELRNFQGQKITHRWQYDGELLADVTFNVGSPRWRVWSKKTLSPNWIGEIAVTVIDEQERVLATEVLYYTEASQP